MMTDKEIKSWLRAKQAAEAGGRSHDYIQACLTETDAYEGTEALDQLRYVKVARLWEDMRREDTNEIGDRIIGVPETDEQGQEYFTFWKLSDITKERHERSLRSRFFSVQRNAGRLLAEIKWVESPPRSWQLNLPFEVADLERLACVG